VVLDVAAPVSAPVVVRRRLSRSRRRILIVLAVNCVLGFIFMLPFLWTVSSSLKTASDLFTFPPALLPSVPQPYNYVRIFVAPYRFLGWSMNSAYVALLATFGTVLTASLVAYGFARFEFRFKNLLFMITIATMLLPGQVTLIPRFVLFKELRWIDTLYPLWVPFWFGGSAFAIFLIRQFILTLPRELDEAAIIDGASYFRIFWNVLIPLCKPAIAALAIISFIAHWDSFLEPIIFLNSPDNFTVAIGLWFFKEQPMVAAEPTTHLLMAASVTSIAVPIALFFSFQRYFVQGIALTGIKG
jgi:multiple sugar transport system permease protein